MPDDPPIVRDIANQLVDRSEFLGLFLAGSYGRGDADQYSDVDFVAVTDPDRQDAAAALWRQTLENLRPIVFWNEQRGRNVLLNAITEDWLRYDVLIIRPEDIKGRAKSTIRPVFDHGNLYATLPDRLPDAVPNARRVTWQINEFIRILGLMRVGLGRGEYVLLVKGTGLLRDLLTDLMLEECPVADKGGILHPSRLLTADQMAVLQGLPYPGPHRSEVIAAHIALAEAFFPRARRLAEQLSIEWPTRFEAATRRVLQSELGISFGSEPKATVKETPASPGTKARHAPPGLLLVAPLVRATNGSA